MNLASLLTIEQGLFLIGSLINLISIQIDKKRIVMMSIIAYSLFIAAGFLVMGKVSPALVSLYSIIIILYNDYCDQWGKTPSKLLLILLPSIVAASNFFTMSTPWDTIYFITPYLFTQMVFSKSTKHIRYYSFVLRFMFMTYNLIVGAYALEIGGIPTLISNGIAIYRHDLRKPRNPEGLSGPV